MKTQRIIQISLILMTCLVTSAAFGADKAELRQRFEQRFPQIVQYKTQGKIGETSAGVLEAVDPKFLDDKALAKLIEEENGDRVQLYQIIAREQNVSPDKAAERAARRNFDRARPGEYLKGPDGKWTRKS
ncbi:MAG TPA: YdbL family protein [Tepidisphaeraceae bacterium]